MLWTAMVLVLLSGGCALFTRPADEIKLNRGDATLAWGTMRTSVALSLDHKAQGCAILRELTGEIEGVLLQVPPTTAARLDSLLRRLRAQPDCDALPAERVKWEGLDQQVSNALRNPGTEVDREAIIQAVMILAKIAGAAL